MANNGEKKKEREMERGRNTGKEDYTTPKSSAKKKPAAKPALDSQSDTLSRYVHIRQLQMVFKIVPSNGDIVLDRSEGFN